MVGPNHRAVRAQGEALLVTRRHYRLEFGTDERPAVIRERLEQRIDGNPTIYVQSEPNRTWLVPQNKAQKFRSCLALVRHVVPYIASNTFPADKTVPVMLPLAMSLGKPLILFPCEPFDARQIDPDFEPERQAAKAAGLETALVDHTRVVEGTAGAAVLRTPEGGGHAVYRGWMLRPSQYGAMHAALQSRGIALINSPEQYRTCHYLPESYPWIEGHTPRSVWFQVEGTLDVSQLARSLAPFGDSSLVVKDYVKSQKHYWQEACFIPKASELSAVERVVRRFLDLQGDDLNQGLVFREFVPLRIVGTHPKSAMPLAAEFRIFWLYGKPILSHRYWGNLSTFDAPLPWAELTPIAERIPSQFFTMDVAFLADGGWTIVELGDGQVAGLPAADLAPEFFRSLSTER